MSDFSINPQEVRSQLGHLDALHANLKNAAQRDAFFKNEVSEPEIGTNLKNISAGITYISVALGELSGVLGQVLSEYESTEQSIIDRAPMAEGTSREKKTEATAGRMGTTGSVAMESENQNDAADSIASDPAACGIYSIKEGTEFISETSMQEESDEKDLKSSREWKPKSLNDQIKDHLEESGRQKTIKDDTFYRKDGKTIGQDENSKESIEGTEVPEFYDREATILEKGLFAAEASRTWHKGEYKIGEDTDIEVTVGDARANASASIGLYSIGDDGRKIFSPGADVEVGASVTVFELEGTTFWVGDEDFGLSSDYSVTVGEADAEAKLGAQIFDEDGKLDVEIGGSVKAEAIAAQVEGSVDLNVMGAQVGVSGRAEVGIGAHAQAQFQDGVVKVDLGAALGIGGSVSFEADLGALVNAASDRCISIWNNVSNIWK